ncbi:hypothetical protein PanWU01x14_078420, partial [Parasponia andersonii]
PPDLNLNLNLNLSLFVYLSLLELSSQNFNQVKFPLVSLAFFFLVLYFQINIFLCVLCSLIYIWLCNWLSYRAFIRFVSIIWVAYFQLNNDSYPSLTFLV